MTKVTSYQISIYNCDEWIGVSELPGNAFKKDRGLQEIERDKQVKMIAEEPAEYGK